MTTPPATQGTLPIVGSTPARKGLLHGEVSHHLWCLRVLQSRPLFRLHLAEAWGWLQP